MQSINFSQDGGRVIDSVLPVREGNMVLKIKTKFPDRGTDEATYFISYEQGSWFLRKIIYFMSYTNGHQLIKCTCIKWQRLNMSKLATKRGKARIRQIPTEPARDKDCTIITAELPQ